MKKRLMLVSVLIGLGLFLSSCDGFSHCAFPNEQRCVDDVLIMRCDLETRAWSFDRLCPEESTCKDIPGVKKACCGDGWCEEPAENKFNCEADCLGTCNYNGRCEREFNEIPGICEDCESYPDILAEYDIGPFVWYYSGSDEDPGDITAYLAAYAMRDNEELQTDVFVIDSNRDHIEGLILEEVGGFELINHNGFTIAEMERGENIWFWTHENKLIIVEKEHEFEVLANEYLEHYWYPSDMDNTCRNDYCGIGEPCIEDCCLPLIYGGNIDEGYQCIERIVRSMGSHEVCEGIEDPIIREFCESIVLAIIGPADVSSGSIASLVS
ncbi:hypothetical protein ACFLZX_05260 [Nanoarchaeota archaeon]